MKNSEMRINRRKFMTGCLDKIHRFLYKHRHKMIFVAFVILFFSIYISLPTLVLNYDDTVSVGFTTTIFAKSHSIKEVFQNFRYPHGSMALYSVLYYPFYLTPMWLTCYTLIPIFTQFSIFLLLYWFNFKYVKKYYILLNMLVLFPSQMTLNFLTWLGGPQEALLLNVIVVLLFLNFMKKRTYLSLLLLGIMSAVSVFIEMTNIIIILSLIIIILLFKDTNHTKKIFYSGVLGFFILLAFGFMTFLELNLRKNGEFGVLFLFTKLADLVHNQGIAHTLGLIPGTFFSNMYGIAILRIPRLFIYYNNISYVFFTLGFFILAGLIAFNYFKKHQNDSLQRFAIYLFIFTLVLHVLLISAMSPLVYPGSANQNAYFMPDSRHDAGLLIPFFLLLALGGLNNKMKLIRFLTLLFIFIIVCTGFMLYWQKNPSTETQVELNNKHLRVASEFESIQKNNSICGFHSTAHNRAVFTFFSHGRLLIDCELDSSCPAYSKFYENQLRQVCDGKKIGYIIPSRPAIPNIAHYKEGAIDKILEKFKKESVRYNISIVTNDVFDPVIDYYVLYNIDQKYDEYIINVSKDSFTWS